MSLMTPGSSDRCRFCRESRETFYHFIKECPRLREHRAKVFQNYDGPETDSWSPENMLCFSKIDVISDAIDYYDWMEEENDSVFDEEEDMEI